jgi:hypothetical protein
LPRHGPQARPCGPRAFSIKGIKNYELRELNQAPARARSNLHFQFLILNSHFSILNAFLPSGPPLPKDA